MNCLCRHAIILTSLLGFVCFTRFNRSTVKEGFKAVKSDSLDAFIYDATVLEYLVGQVRKQRLQVALKSHALFFGRTTSATS